MSGTSMTLTDRTNRSSPPAPATSRACDMAGTPRTARSGGQPGGILVRGVPDLRAVAPEGREVVVDLWAAVAWSPRLPAAARSLPHPGQLLPLLEGAGDPFARAAAARIDALRSALLSGDA